MRLTGSNQPERGTVVIIVATALMMLAGVAAIALDGGMGYNERRSTQNAADNAALAGAWALCNGGDAIAAALKSAKSNGFEPPHVSVPKPSDDTVVVYISSNTETGFGRTQGIATMEVASKAEARCIPSGFGPGSDMIQAAIFAGGSSCPATHIGNNATIDGLIYSNTHLHISNNHTINGPVYADGNLDVGNNVRISGIVHTNQRLTVGNNAIHDDASRATYVIAPPNMGNHTSTWDPLQVAPRDPVDYPVDFDVTDYAPGGSKAQSAGSDYHHRPSGLTLGNNASMAGGLYFVEGNVSIGNNPTGNVTIVATGRVTIGNNPDFTPYLDGLGVMSLAGSNSCSSLAIDVGNNAKPGVLFAPHGYIQLGNNAFNGTAIGYRVQLGNNNTIKGSEIPWGASDPEVVLSE